MSEEIGLKRDEKGRLVKGTPPGPGRPVGTRNFQTDFDEVVEEIAKANNITNSEARKILIKKAYSEAKDGNFQYYKDLVERVYGKVPDRLDAEVSFAEGLTLEEQIKLKALLNDQSSIRKDDVGNSKGEEIPS